MNTKTYSSIPLINIILIVIVIGIGIYLASFFFTKKSINPNGSISQGDCSQFSIKDGYTGCMSLMNGAAKKCKFKVDNKINQETQKMEFEYTCLEK